MGRRWSWGWGWLLAFALVATGPRALAQNDSKASAKAKLVEGGEFLKQGEYKEALGRFKEAYDLVPSPKIFYNFGLAYTGLGRTTNAVEAFERFLDEAADANPELRADAERRKSQLVPQIASIVVDCDTEGADISVDGRPYGTTPRKNPIRLDPGPHSLVVKKASAPAFTQELKAEPGKRLVVDVKLIALLPPVPPEPVAVPQTPPPIAPVDPSPLPARSWKEKAAWGGAAGAVAALGFGFYQQAAASSKYEEFNNYAAPTPPNPYGKCDADSRVSLPNGGGDCSRLLADGDAASVRALVGFIVGGALAAGSVTLFVLSRREQREQTMAVSFGCAPMGRGVTCDVRF